MGSLDKSKEAFLQASKSIPGGVDSPVRAFGAVGGNPPFIESGKGSKITDIDGNTYVDYVCSWGPLILGHADDYVVKKITEAVGKGTSFGAPTVHETKLAELIKDRVPSIEKVRMVSSGTEATMSAIRLARGFTGKDIVVKFNGCYHGHVDALLVKAGSGLMTFGTPTSPGVPDDYVKNTVVLPYNDIEAVKACCKEYAKRIACIIIEPIAANMGVVLPKAGYLEALRKITSEEGILLIFDEIISGFRVAPGGAQQLYGITPDLTTFGKIIGGGMPVGAYGGKAEVMDKISPVGPVYQAGTLSGNPVAMAAGIATLERLGEKDFYKDLDEKANILAEGLVKAAKDAGVQTYNTKVGSLLCTFFTDGEVTDFESASKCDTKMFGKYFQGMLERGFYFAPSQFEAAFVSAKHTNSDIEETIKACSEVMKTLGGGSGTGTFDFTASDLEIDDELAALGKTLSNMCYKATEILSDSIDGFLKNNIELVNKAEKQGKELHYEEAEIVTKLIAKAKLTSSAKEKKYISGLITVGNHIELIEDNVLKLLVAIRKKIEESLLFSDKAVDELNYLFSNTKGILKSTADALVTKNRIIGKHILEEETIVRQKACDFETVHEDRMISGVCVPQGSRLYIDMVNSIREINWHVRQVLERIFADK